MLRQGNKTKHLLSCKDKQKQQDETLSFLISVNRTEQDKATPRLLTDTAGCVCEGVGWEGRDRGGGGGEEGITSAL